MLLVGEWQLGFFSDSIDSGAIDLPINESIMFADYMVESIASFSDVLLDFEKDMVNAIGVAFMHGPKVEFGTYLAATTRF